MPKLGRKYFHNAHTSEQTAAVHPPIMEVQHQPVKGLGDQFLPKGAHLEQTIKYPQHLAKYEVVMNILW